MYNHKRLITQICRTVFFIVTHLIFVRSQELGSDCHIKGILLGKCMDFFECHHAMDEFYRRGIYPKVCQSDKKTHIVCCLPTSPLPSPTEDPTIPPDQTSIREKKCTQYAEYVYENIVDTESGVTVRRNRCRKYPPIDHLEEVLPLEFPHLALLGYQKENKEIVWTFVASLVSSRYVLTSPGALSGPTRAPPVLKVRLGELNIGTSKDDALPMDYDIEKTIIHPFHRDQNSSNDIALAKLAKQAILSPYVRPICLPSTDSEPDRFIATGSRTKMNKHVPEKLFKLTVHSYSNVDVCSALYADSLERVLFPDGIQTTQRCIAPLEFNVYQNKTCDIGSPIQLYHDVTACSFVQIGITSYNPCDWSLPAVYTRVFDYAEWIESIIWAPGEDF